MAHRKYLLSKVKNTPTKIVYNRCARCNHLGFDNVDNDNVDNVINADSVDNVDKVKNVDKVENVDAVSSVWIQEMLVHLKKM